MALTVLFLFLKNSFYSVTTKYLALTTNSLADTTDFKTGEFQLILTNIGVIVKMWKRWFFSPMQCMFYIENHSCRIWQIWCTFIYSYYRFLESVEVLLVVTVVTLKGQQAPIKAGMDEKSAH